MWKLPSAAPYITPPNPGSSAVVGAHSCHLPVVGEETVAPASLPAGPWVGGFDVWL